MKKNIEAVLFDFDGTLAKTMEDNFLAWKNAFNKWDVEINKEEYYLLEGLTLKNIAKTLGGKYNLPEESHNSLVDLKKKFFLENNSFSFYPGVEKGIENLKKRKIKLAIVSASDRKRLSQTIPKYFLEKFNVIISGDDCTHGKPSPEPYLMALKKLSIPNEKCIVIENAPLGIKSAKSAGIYCIAITNTLDKKYLSEADKIINNFEELFFIYKF